MAIFQIRFGSDGRLPLYPGERHIRAAVWRLARATHGALVMFGFIHEHGHLLVVDQAGHIERFKKRAAMKLGAVAAEPMEEVWHDRVESRSHLASLVRYYLEQTYHHGVPAHPALWSGSCFVDLVGARVVSGLDLRLFEVLPSLTRDKLMEIVGLPLASLRPAMDSAVRALGALRLRDAAAAALAADPALAQNDAACVRARRVVVRLAARAGISLNETANVLRVTPDAVTRLARREVEETWVAATRRRLALEEAVRLHIEQDWYRRVIEKHASKKAARLVR